MSSREEPAAMTSKDVREKVVEAIRLDVVGPDNQHAFARELLQDSPSRWYLTGYLVPTDAPTEQKSDEEASDEIDSAADAGGADDGAVPDRDAARKRILASSMGVSVLATAQTQHLEVVVSWGDYVFEGSSEQPADSPEHEKADKLAPEPGDKTQVPAQRRGYRRIPKDVPVRVDLSASTKGISEVPVPNSDGLYLATTVREVSNDSESARRLTAGTRSVSVFLVNRRPPNKERAYPTFVFQVQLEVRSEESFVPRPDLRGAGDSSDWDEKVGDLQYRDVFEYAVGHGVSAKAVVGPDGRCQSVKTTWIPEAEVERVAPSAILDVELGMEALGQLASADDAVVMLTPLVTHYRAWIEIQRQQSKALTGARADTARELLQNAEYMAKRIEAGIQELRDPQVLDAFCLANRAMGRSARQRESIQRLTSPETVDAPKWRPFQLAFFLLSIKGIVNPLHFDRETVDLLFFPTGGGKTEAYLGLSAFTMVMRRLRNPGIHSAGVTVLMRYTLRLLTLDQLGRASALMCALELERETQTEKLGKWPFEIGLWVGSAATPNRMGYQGYDGPGADSTAYIRARRFAQDSGRNPSPIPLENCPWCGKKFGRNSFRLVPNPPQRPLDLRVHCINPECLFSGDRPLPIIGVDEPIYRRLPAFLIATVDKFAALPWIGQVGTLFGLVDRYDKNGFYGPSTGPNQAQPLGGPLPPPELIIQDELHLISGPLGTIAGVYEAAIDWLASRRASEKTIRPKVIASTATVRRADSQIRALFDRHQTAIFPPPGPDRRDSFFAHTEPAGKSPARLYVGIAAQGKSLKVVLLRASLAILSAAQTAYEQAGGRKNKENPADPYMTLLGYFNSLRELGGSRRIVEDEIRTRLSQYSRRRRLEPEDRLFSDRDIDYDVLELTSRVSTSDVAAAKRRLSLPFYEDENVDVALATNMISVGLDIIRLGLMVVLGQPKTSAEYIQATSRVGRDPNKPGLVVTLLNIHKPRDRSHYERFSMYHSTFYRAVEPTSITPYSPRALDRALVASLVGLCRHGNATMTPPLGAGEILQLRSSLDQFAIAFAERARNHRTNLTAEQSQRLYDQVLALCRSVLDDWLLVAQEYQRTTTRLQYQVEEGAARRLIYDFLHPDLPKLTDRQRRFRANRSMRDVETGVELTVKNLNDWGG